MAEARSALKAYSVLPAESTSTEPRPDWPTVTVAAPAVDEEVADDEHADAATARASRRTAA
jgi:hypothetical protein